LDNVLLVEMRVDGFLIAQARWYDVYFVLVEV
jgi:hypothetical protein